MPPKTFKKETKKPLPYNPNQLPPQDIEAEQSVLGSLLIDKDAIIKIADITTANDFYRKSHEMIFDSMIELYTKSEPIDLLTVSSKLKEKKQLKEIGGMSYLTTLMNFVPTASNVIHYAKIAQSHFPTFTTMPIIAIATKPASIGDRSSAGLTPITCASSGPKGNP